MIKKNFIWKVNKKHLKLQQQISWILEKVSFQFVPNCQHFAFQFMRECFSLWQIWISPQIVQIAEYSCDNSYILQNISCQPTNFIPRLSWLNWWSEINLSWHPFQIQYLQFRLLNFNCPCPDSVSIINRTMVSVIWWWNTSRPMQTRQISLITWYVQQKKEACNSMKCLKSNTRKSCL